MTFKFLKPHNLWMSYLLILGFMSSVNGAQLSTEQNKIYIVNHGWHTGIIMSSELIKHMMPELNERFKHKTFIEFGWGDKGFYQANEITTKITLKAIFTPSESVMHAVGFNTSPPQYFKSSEMQALCLSDIKFNKLNRFIKDSFLVDDKNNIIKQRKGIYGDSQFYKGVGAYHLTNTCNKWTANALKQMGVDINPIFKLTAQSVMSSINDLDKQSCSD